MVLGFGGVVPNLLIGALSIFFVVFGAEKVVDKMEAVAKYYGVSETVIAVTIISIGTSLPELALHVVGSLNILANPGNEELFRTVSATVLGSNIGSDVVQQTLVLGLVLIAAARIGKKKGFEFSSKFLKRDYAPMMFTTLMCIVLGWDRVYSRLDGLILVGSFAIYLLYQYSTRKEQLADQGNVKPSDKPRIDFIVGLVFMIVVVYSADVFLKVVELGIEATGLSGSMIGVATVGVVSALPEMITAIQGLREGAEGISLGTLIGSNITNPLFAIGTGALISTYAVPDPLVLWDLPMETATAFILLVYMFNKERIGDMLAPAFDALGFESAAERLRNTENFVLTASGAALLVAMYFFYMYVRWTYFPTDFL